MTSEALPELAKSDEGKAFLSLLLQAGYSNSSTRLRRSLLIFAAIFLIGAIFDILPKETPSLGVTVSRERGLFILAFTIALLLPEYVVIAGSEFHALRKLPQLGSESLKDFFEAERHVKTMQKYNERMELSEDERAEHYVATVAFWKPGSDFSKYFQAMAVAAGDAKTIRRATRAYLLKIYYQYTSTLWVGISCPIVYLLLVS